MRYLHVPLEGTRLPLVVRVPQFDKSSVRAYIATYQQMTLISE